MYETYYHGLAGMTRDQLFIERDCFYFTLDAILSHPDNRQCNGQYKLLYWDNDPEMSMFSRLLLILHRHHHLYYRRWLWYTGGGVV